MAQTALFIIFLVEFVMALGVLLTWKPGYELSSFEEGYPPPSTATTSPGRCRTLQLARHRRKKTRRQRKRCKLGSHRQEG
jgi:hypothetical protein